VSDTEEDLWPDSTTRTEARMSNLQFQLLQYEREAGHMPSSLADLPVMRETGQATRDAWGNIIRFRRAQNDDYELRAPGRDGVPETADDIVATKDTVLPRPRPDPLSISRTTMQSLQRLITIFERRTGSLPRDLNQLASAGLRPYLGTEDYWGRPIRYSSGGNGLELRSAGPDGQLATSDDIVVHGRLPLTPDSCTDAQRRP
jgi:hypothetical protein